MAFSPAFNPAFYQVNLGPLLGIVLVRITSDLELRCLGEFIEGNGPVSLDTQGNIKAYEFIEMANILRLNDQSGLMACQLTEQVGNI
jgi:hypothetical protein